MRQLKNFSNKSEKTVDDKDAVRDYISKYDGFSEDRLVDELIKTVKKAKESGTYNEGQMETFVSMVSPQLSESQKTKLNNMIELIKTGEI